MKYAVIFIILFNTIAAAAPESGDMYVASSIGDASYLNPVLATDQASGSINNLIYNGLLKYDKDLKITGDLAESWEVGAGGLTITFHLRPNVKWHDGKPFTAKDVLFTYNKLVDPRVKTPYGADYLLVKTISAINPLTVRVTYKQPFAPALESWMIGIVPEYVFTNTDFNSAPANRAPIGTGPFLFKEWKTDEKIVLAANPNYFEGKPFINKYVLRIIPDQSVEFLELRQQNIDEMGLTPDQYRAYKEFFTSYNRFNYPSFSYVYMAFNQQNPLYKKHDFRLAIASALDKTQIIDGVLLRMGKAATGPFVPQSWAHDPEVKDFPFDPQKARELLKALGFQDINNDGFLEYKNQPWALTIMTNQGNKMRQLTCEIIQSQLKAVGLKVNIRVVEWSAFIHQFIDKKNFDCVVLGWSLGRDPDQYAIWHSSQSGEGQYNFISYSNPKVDALLERGRRTFAQSERQKIYRTLHKELHDDIAYIFLYYPLSLPAVHKRFVGPEVTPAGLGWNFHKWWSPKDKQKYTAE
jgi:peptide/nickel transport system substrate-binding protein